MAWQFHSRVASGQGTQGSQLKRKGTIAGGGIQAHGRSEMTQDKAKALYSAGLKTTTVPQRTRCSANDMKKKQ